MEFVAAFKMAMAARGVHFEAEYGGEFPQVAVPENVRYSVFGIPVSTLDQVEDLAEIACECFRHQMGAIERMDMAIDDNTIFVRSTITLAE